MPRRKREQPNSDDQRRPDETYPELPPPLPENLDDEDDPDTLLTQIRNDRRSAHTWLAEQQHAVLDALAARDSARAEAARAAVAGGLPPQLVTLILALWEAEATDIRARHAVGEAYILPFNHERRMDEETFKRHSTASRRLGAAIDEIGRSLWVLDRAWDHLDDTARTDWIGRLLAELQAVRPPYVAEGDLPELSTSLLLRDAPPGPAVTPPPSVTRPVAPPVTRPAPLKAAGAGDATGANVILARLETLGRQLLAEHHAWLDAREGREGRE